MRIYGAELEAPKINTATNPEEFTSDSGNTFARDDFTGGAGLLRAHERDLPVDAARRYWDSRNIDTAFRPGGELRDIRLLHTTELADASASTGLRMVWTGSRLLRAGATTIRVSTDPLAGSFSDESPHVAEGATTVSDVAFLGTTEYSALNANGIHEKVSGGSWAHYNALAADRLWSVGGDKQRLVGRGNSGRSLYEVVASGAAPSALITLPPGETFTGVTDAEGAILASATNGYIYAFSVNSSGNLALLGQTHIPGEHVTAVAGTGTTTVMFGTGADTVGGGTIGRLYRAELSSAGVLENRQTIWQWGDESETRNRAPQVFVVSRDVIYTVVREDANETHVWRYDLAGGMSRWWIVAAGALCTGAALVDGRFVCALDGVGIYRQTQTYAGASDNYLIGPFGDHFDAGDKNWVGARLETSVVPSGGRVDLYFSTDTDDMSDADSVTWLRGRTAESGETASGEEPLNGIYARGIVGKIVLTKGTSDTPKVRSFGFRSQPGASDVLIDLPVDVGDQVERRNRRPHRVTGRGQALWAALEAKRGRACTLTIFRPDGLFSGQITNVSAPIQVLTARGSVTQYALVTFRGQATDSAGSAEEGSALGLGVLGLDVMGGVV